MSLSVTLCQGQASHGGECIRIVWIALQKGAYVCNRCDGNCIGDKSHVSGFVFRVLSFKLLESKEPETIHETVVPDTRNSGSKGERRAREAAATADQCLEQKRS